MLPPPRSTLFPYTTLFRSEVFEPRRGAAADPKDRIPCIVRRADQAGEMRPRGILVGVRARGPRALQDERVFRGTGRDRGTSRSWRRSLGGFLRLTARGDADRDQRDDP